MSGVTHCTANIVCAALLLMTGLPLVAAADRGRPAARDGAAAPCAFAAVDAVLDRYVAEGRVAGLVGLVAREGVVVYRRAVGRRSVARTDPLEPGDRFRIASMTKPVTSVAAMILVERGQLGLDDPVARYVPEFGAVGVYEAAGKQRRPRRPITVRDLLTHTSGLTSGTFEATPVDALYRERLGTHDRTLAQLSRDLAALPLVADPGDRFIYSYSTDVLGRVIEVVSGSALDTFLEREVFSPLGMTHTGFSVALADERELADVHEYDDGGRLKAIVEDTPTVKPLLLSASGGLFSTADDYWRFARMLLDEGSFDGRRLLSRETVHTMTRDHLGPTRLPWRVGGRPRPGRGFCFGVGVILDRTAAEYAAGNGSYYWGGSYNTFFWVDPRERLVGIVLSQLLPFQVVPLEHDFQQAVYESLRMQRPVTALY